MSMDIAIHDKTVRNGTFWNSQGEVDYVDEWFLMDNPLPVFLILMGYWSFVLKLGPEYMKNKPAFYMGKILAIYNVSQIAISCYLCYIGTTLMLPHGFISSSCLTDEETSKFLVASCIYAYFIAKLTELFDTVFFVLRKNYRQITFLHVYHHSVMVLISWFTLKYEPSYNIMFVGTLNSYVHVVMYTYYYLSLFPGLGKYLWWKKYITKMQITQFILILSQAAASYYFSGCPPSYFLLSTVLFNASLFTGLFINFYINAYNERKKIN